MAVAGHALMTLRLKVRVQGHVVIKCVLVLMSVKLLSFSSF